MVLHFGVLLTSRFAPSALSSDWIFSRGVPSDPFEEVMIFDVSRGVPTVPFEEVKKFLKHIDKDMITPLFCQLEKVIIFCHKQTFFVTNGELQLTFMPQLEKMIICRRKQIFFVTKGGSQLTF